MAPPEELLAGFIADVAAKLDAMGRGSRTELAEYLGVPHTKISPWLKGEIEPSGKIVLGMMEFTRKRR